MKEIKSILEKLSDLSNSNTGNTALDIDLMLDYTRRLYEVLLSERKKNDSDTSLLSTTKTIHEEEKPIMPESVLDAALEASESESTDLTEETTFSEPINENTEPEPIVSEQEASLSISQDKEQELAEQLYAHESNISFEPPHPAEEQPFFPEEGIEEDKPEENTVPIQSIPVPLDGEEALSDYAQIFNYASKPKGQASRDIRKMIGINDKYLFLNELFNSQKKAYEDALDKLNNMTEYKEAANWVRNEIAPLYKWYEDDETVLDFYDTLAKHFSAR